MKVDVTKIDALMKEKDISRSALSNKTGIEYNTLTSIFRRASTSTETAYKIADALGVTVEDIIPGATVYDDEKLFLKEKGGGLAVFAYQDIDDCLVQALAETVLIDDFVKRLGIDERLKKALGVRIDMLVDAVYDAAYNHGAEGCEPEERHAIRESARSAMSKVFRNM